MSHDRNGIFDYLLRMVRFGLGGTAGTGQQYVSWIHYLDFIGAVKFLIGNEQNHRRRESGVAEPASKP
jgi:hypothetical protein